VLDVIKMNAIGYASLARILAVTSFGFRKIVNRAIELTQSGHPEAQQAREELFLAFSRNMRGNKVNVSECTKWLVSAVPI
jgi:hypothetical protein